MSITHSFVSAKSDGGDATLVRPSDWNAAHVLEGFHPTIIQDKSTENSSSSSVAVTLDSTPTVGSRIIVGVSGLGRDANSVSATNITFTKMGVANNSTTIFAAIWVGVVGSSPGSTITASFTGNNFNQISVVEVPDQLTPTVSNSATANGANVIQSTRATLTRAQAVAERFWACYGATDNGTVPIVIWASQPSQSNSSSTCHLQVGYCVGGGSLMAAPVMGTTNADYAVYLATIT